MKTNLAEIYTSLPQSDVPEIVAKFEENNKRFKYYVSNDAAQKLYVACYNSMKQLFVDNGDMNQPDDSYVYKMMFLFQSRDLAPSTTLAAFDKFAQKYINGFVSLKAFLEGRHIASFEFADNAEYGIFDYDVVAMRKALPTLGYTLLKNLADIGKITSV